MPKQPSRDGVFRRSDAPGWYASYVDANGKRRKCRVQAHTRVQATDALGLIKARVQKEKITGVRHVSEMATTDLLKRFKNYQRPRVAASTYERLGDILTTLGTRLPAKLKDISKAVVADFVAARAQEVSPGTIAKEVATLKHALRMAVEWELIHSNPAERAKLPTVPEGRTRYLTPTELRCALDEAPEWMRAPMALAAFTGMRRGELLNLRWRDVDLSGRRLYLLETKNKTMRVVPLNELAAGVLDSLPQGAPADAVLPGVDPARLTVYTKRIFAKLGIEDASFHSLRHTAASWLVMNGADLYATGAILGHRTPRMTQRYAHLAPDYMAATAGKIDAAFRKELPLPSKITGLPRD